MLSLVYDPNTTERLNARLASMRWYAMYAELAAASELKDFANGGWVSDTVFFAPDN